jgi:hypothetical protein
MHRNHPDIDCKYNYVYKITCKVNGKEYIGVHRTNNIDDGYMGSGKMIKWAILKYGVENFQKDILHVFPTYKEALLKEKEIVTVEYANRADTYNLREGGYGRCRWSDEVKAKQSMILKNRWMDSEYRNKMLSMFNDDTTRLVRSENMKRWIASNPDKHKAKMLKINTDPNKISKTADKHRGSKRTEAVRRKLSEIQQRINIERGSTIKGKGMMYIHNTLTGERKRVSADYNINGDWVKGTGPRDKNSYKDLNKGSVFAYDPATLKISRFQSRENVPANFILGRPKKLCQI